jgi:hypothetical protein
MVRLHWQHIVLFLLLGLLISCRPHQVLSKKKMVEVLYDIHLAEAMNAGITGPVPASWDHGLSPDYFRDLSYQSVLKKHHITEEDFFRSVGYYSRDVEKYGRIYAEVEKRLQRYKDQLVDEKKLQDIEAELRRTIQRDSVKINHLYRILRFQTDSTLVLRNSYFPDSASIYFKKEGHRWWPSYHSLQKQDSLLFIKTANTALPLPAPELGTDNSRRGRYIQGFRPGGTQRIVRYE